MTKLLHPLHKLRAAVPSEHTAWLQLIRPVETAGYQELLKSGTTNKDWVKFPKWGICSDCSLQRLWPLLESLSHEEQEAQWNWSVTISVSVLRKSQAEPLRPDQLFVVKNPGRVWLIVCVNVSARQLTKLSIHFHYCHREHSSLVSLSYYLGVFFVIDLYTLVIAGLAH